MEKKLTMSNKEIKRLPVIKECLEKRITVVHASELMRISERHTYRILKRYRAGEANGIIHRGRGKKSNRGYPEAVKQQVLSLYWKKYRDFGPTLFSEKLKEYEGIDLNHETVRRWMRDNGIITQERKKRPHRRRRERRSSFGAMLQLDGSHHDWFEGRGPMCCLLNMVDDATGSVYLRFSDGENTVSVLSLLMNYCLQYGIPGSVYTDYHGVYYGDGKPTDYQRALKKLDIETIYARSPQAKGRVERSNRTHQDRLVKEMRLRQISTIDDANKFLDEYFIAHYNEKFMVESCGGNVHRSCDGLALEQIFCFENRRQIKNDYTFSFQGIDYQIEHSEAIMPHAGDSVFIRDYLDASRHIFSAAGEELSIRRLKKLKKKDKVAVTHFPADNHPWRQ